MSYIFPKDKRNPKRVAYYNQFLKTLDARSSSHQTPKPNTNLQPTTPTHPLLSNLTNKPVKIEHDPIDESILNLLDSMGMNVRAPNTKIMFYKASFPFPLSASSAPSSSSSTSSALPEELLAKGTQKPTREVTIEANIQNIQDLIALVETYPDDPNVAYNVNMKALHAIQAPLKELNAMVGMKSLKQSIVDQIVYFVQGLHKNQDGNGEFLHTVIYGPPGTGKTEIAKLMGKIYSQIGILSKGTFKKVTRDDLVAGYLGQTALKTREVIKEALGGVLFIDEAYSLGNPEKKDSFAKECIDVLCEALSEHKGDLMVIIAGYEKELKECFFSFNPGLQSRFNWRFQTDDYSHSDLCKIFLKKVGDIGWHTEAGSEAKIEAWFQKHKDCFPFYGRDAETLLTRTKIAHGRRVFCRPASEKKVLTVADLDKGFDLYLNNDELQKKREEDAKNSYLYSTLYC